jgi:hypothetical protein
VSRLRNQPGPNGDLVSQGDSQIAALMALQQQVGSASPSLLALMHGSVTAAVTAATTLASQAEAQSATGQNNVSTQQLANATMAARETVAEFQDSFFKRKIFDPYMHFDSAEDRDAYYAREAERQTAIQAALAKNTPEGAHEAAVLSRDQLKDAGAHGADQSPEYQPMLARLNKSADDLEASMATQRMSAEHQAGTEVDRAVATENALPVAPSAVPADVLAKIRAAGLTVASSGEGHGLKDRPDPSSPARQT